MYDGNGFQLSEFYFAILQVLRIASVWIKESMSDLSTLVDDIEERFFSAETAEDWITFLPDSTETQHEAIKVFKQNWGSVISHQRRIGNGLLNRIAKKEEEIKSLRDGVRLPSNGVE
jgi:hypothetical protein